MTNLEKRVAELERKLEAFERRREKLIARELLDDENVIELCTDHVKNAVAGWRLCLKENGVSLAHAKFLDAQRQALSCTARVSRIAPQTSPLCRPALASALCRPRYIERCF